MPRKKTRVPPPDKYFPSYGVQVKIPTRPNPINVFRRAKHTGINMHPIGIGFTPFRNVINLKVVDFNNPGTELFKFSPPITVKVRYDTNDYNNGGANIAYLKLGYWDGKKWTVCTAATHKLYVQPDDPSKPQDGGQGTFEVDHWNDPTISWGT